MLISLQIGHFQPILAVFSPWTRSRREPLGIRASCAAPDARSAGAPDPPENGRIVTYAGVGSYMLWRSPRAPVALNGWLEHFTPQQLSDHSGK